MHLGMSFKILSQ